MIEGKCRECGSTVSIDSLKYCFYCWNKSKIEAEGFKSELVNFYPRWKAGNVK
ncbi:MAG: hypothetical protein ABIH92_05635 [Nanoarchaeota archaeon]